MAYDFKRIEKKWQKKWEEKKIFQVKESKKKKFYVLDMFPYPSGKGLHIGHAFVFSLGDIFARFKRLQGCNVLYPMGYDSLGLPAENAAIKANTHPEEYTKKSIVNFIKQQKAMGWSYDWKRVVKASDPKYYKWDQWIFLKMLEKGIAYRKKAPVNWCSKCQTVLANEQVEKGKCWRHPDTDVEIKHLEQWFLKITDYVEELLKGLKDMDWPQRAKTMQKNWIGKSFGTEIDFEINGKKWPVFTTRPDTIYGVTFMVISAQHARLFDIVTKEQKKDVKIFLKKLKSVSEKELENMEKEGVFTGNYAINPINKEKVPIYVGNFVLADYGSGMVMAVPAHDQRDFEFAKKYDIEIRQVIVPNLGKEKQDKEIENMFNIIKEISNELEDKKIKVWFNGTFGVIGHYNELFTKPNDVDCGVIKRDFEKAQKLIENLGYEKIGEKDNGKFKVTTFKKKGIELQLGTFDKDLGDDIAEINKIKYRIPNAGWLAECYKITSKKYKRKNMNDFERAIFLELISGKSSKSYMGEGKLINSGKFNSINSLKAIEEITKHLAQKKLGKKAIQFKLRDWLISRQRYWGAPIPIVYCDKCGIVPVLEKDLPIELPKKVKFGKGNPLETADKWINVKCPKCKGKAKRETDTMDTFVNSSWYFLRYTDPKNDKTIFDKKKANYWAPIDQYIGGPEHITMHLIYIRFYTKFLRDLGLLNFDEPALKYFTQGIVKGKDGEKMSKSRGNIIEPLDMINKYGADSLRLYLVSNSSPDSDFDWNDKGMLGVFKFINKIYNYFEKFRPGKINSRIESKLNKNILEVTKDIESFKHNLAIIKIRELFNLFLENEIDKKTTESFLKLLHVYCPFVTEELWSKLGHKNFISVDKWPKADKKKIDEKFEKEDEMISKLKSDINNIKKILNKEKARVYVYVMPNEVEIYKDIEGINVFAVNDKKKYDPENKSKKAKPGKPGIYLE